MATAASIERDNAFIDRYQILSIPGRWWTRKMLIDSAVRGGFGEIIKRSDVAAVVDDDAFMRKHKGSIPRRVVDAIRMEVLMRRLKEI